jgi:hypothetical protein
MYNNEAGGGGQYGVAGEGGFFGDGGGDGGGGDGGGGGGYWVQGVHFSSPAGTVVGVSSSFRDSNPLTI